jgi:hypothetical protein
MIPPRGVPFPKYKNPPPPPPPPNTITKGMIMNFNCFGEYSGKYVVTDVNDNSITMEKI